MTQNPFQNGHGHYADPDTLPNIVRRSEGYQPQPQTTPVQPQVHDVEALILRECQDLAVMLAQKNRDYGNSALDPMRVFSRAAPIEQLLVRIDDKLSRIKNRTPNSTSEDAIMDLMGYLVLLRVAAKVQTG